MNKIYLIILSLSLVCCSKHQKDGNPDGFETVKDYYDTGELWSTTKKLDGKQHGLTVFYYKNGDTLEVENWQGGLKNGEAVRYYPNGKVEKLYTFKNDTLTQALGFQKDGTKEFWQLFGDGGIITQEYLYDSIGVVYNTEPFISVKPDNDTLIYGRKNSIDVFAINYDSTSQMDFFLFKVIQKGKKVIRDTIPFDSIRANYGKITIEPAEEGKYQLAGVIIENFAPKRELMDGDTFIIKEHWQSWEIFMK